MTVIDVECVAVCGNKGVGLLGVSVVCVCHSRMEFRLLGVECGFLCNSRKGVVLFWGECGLCVPFREECVVVGGQMWFVCVISERRWCCWG